MQQSQPLLIIDNSLVWALSLFVICFSFFYLYAWWRLRMRQQKLEDYFEERYLVSTPGEAREKTSPGPRFKPKHNRLQIAFRALLLAGLASLMSFLVLALAPLPFLHNFATSSAWRLDPLRVTDLRFERFHEGFSLDVELWNQSEEDLEGLKARVTIWDLNEEKLDEIVIGITPDPLPTGKAGRFEIRYEENSPFLGGYQIDFLNPQDQIVPYQEGFDAP